MNKEELEKEAIKRVDAFIDNFSQDVRSTLYDRLNQEDVKDFLYGLYIDSAEPREKRIAELEERVQKQSDELYNRYAETKFYKENWKNAKQENAELKEKFNAGNISFEEWLIYCKEQGLNLATQEMEQEEIDEMLEDCWIASRYNSDATSLCLKQSIQLTKAKELLKEFVHHYKAKTIYIENMQDLLEQAEQFLKESEGK